jgi:hypothetical protein
MRTALPWIFSATGPQRLAILLVSRREGLHVRTATRRLLEDEVLGGRAPIDFVQDGIAFADVGDLDSWDTIILPGTTGSCLAIAGLTSSFGAALFSRLTSGTTKHALRLDPSTDDERSIFSMKA